MVAPPPRSLPGPGRGARDYAPAVIDGPRAEIQQLFLVEQEAIEEGFAGSMRHLHLRRDRSGPNVDRIFRTLEAEVGQFSPKSSVAHAMRYVFNQKNELRHFLRGVVPMWASEGKWGISRRRGPIARNLSTS